MQLGDLHSYNNKLLIISFDLINSHVITIFFVSWEFFNAFLTHKVETW